jgi:hypothetical protein
MSDYTCCMVFRKVRTRLRRDFRAPRAGSGCVRSFVDHQKIGSRRECRWKLRLSAVRGSAGMQPRASAIRALPGGNRMGPSGRAGNCRRRSRGWRGLIEISTPGFTAVSANHAPPPDTVQFVCSAALAPCFAPLGNLARGIGITLLNFPVDPIEETPDRKE